MRDETAAELLRLNRRFYDEFGEAFAATRKKIQPGVNRILAEIPTDQPSDWLDLGCGSGVLGRIWAEQGRTGSYTGLDFSGPLLREAEKETEGLSGEHLTIRYETGDLMDPSWPNAFAGTKFDGVFAFASLHHIPGEKNHRGIFAAVRDLLKPGGCFIFSVWQFQNSPRLMKRVQDWSLASLHEWEMEPGDTLLDWRYVLPGMEEKHGLRYVHLFREEELDRIAAAYGFRREYRFYSDGAEGNLALYTRLRISE